MYVHLDVFSLRLACVGGLGVVVPALVWIVLTQHPIFAHPMILFLPVCSRPLSSEWGVPFKIFD